MQTQESVDQTKAKLMSLLSKFNMDSSSTPAISTGKTRPATAGTRLTSNQKYRMQGNEQKIYNADVPKRAHSPLLLGEAVEAGGEKFPVKNADSVMGVAAARLAQIQKDCLSPPLPLMRFSAEFSRQKQTLKTITGEKLLTIPNLLEPDQRATDSSFDKLNSVRDYSDSLHDPVLSQLLAKWFSSRSYKESNWRQMVSYGSYHSDTAASAASTVDGASSLPGRPDLMDVVVYETLMYTESVAEREARNRKRKPEEEYFYDRWERIQQQQNPQRARLGQRRGSSTSNSAQLPQQQQSQSQPQQQQQQQQQKPQTQQHHVVGAGSNLRRNSIGRPASASVLRREGMERRNTVMGTAGTAATSASSRKDRRGSGVGSVGSENGNFSSSAQTQSYTGPKFTPSLKFSAEFESGNLEKATRVIGRETLMTGRTLDYLQNAASPGDVDQEYDLVLRKDVNTDGNIQWYYFCATAYADHMFTPEGSSAKFPLHVRFNIINMQKKDSLYNYGMKPVTYSLNQLHNEDWQRRGRDICYYRNGLTQLKATRSAKVAVTYQYSLSFTYTFQQPDTVYFAHAYPYTYSDLQNYLTVLAKEAKLASFYHRRQLCQTIAGNSVDLLTITERSSGMVESRNKPAIIVTARVHPGETNASYMMHGFIRFILSDQPEAVKLRRSFVISIVPMMNPDGVIHGNYRCSLAGTDLNRRYRDAVPRLHPTVLGKKALFTSSQNARNILLYVDLHGHSRNKNSFVYGCDVTYQPESITQRLNSQLGADEVKRRRIFSRIFPKILCSISNSNSNGYFSYRDCSFAVAKSKFGTGRVVAWQEFGIPASYTIEASFCGNGDNAERRVLKQVCDPSPHERRISVTMASTAATKQRQAAGKAAAVAAATATATAQSTSSNRNVRANTVAIAAGGGGASGTGGIAITQTPHAVLNGDAEVDTSPDAFVGAGADGQADSDDRVDFSSSKRIGGDRTGAATGAGAGGGNDSNEDGEFTFLKAAASSVLADEGLRRLAAQYPRARHYTKQDLLDMGRDIGLAIYHFANLSHSSLENELKIATLLDTEERAKARRKSNMQELMKSPTATAGTARKGASRDESGGISAENEANICPVTGFDTIDETEVTCDANADDGDGDGDVDGSDEDGSDVSGESDTDSMAEGGGDSGPSATAAATAAGSGSASGDGQGRGEGATTAPKRLNRRKSLDNSSSNAPMNVDEFLKDYSKSNVNNLQKEMTVRSLLKPGVFTAAAIQYKLLQNVEEFTHETATPELGMRMKCEYAIRKGLGLDEEIQQDKKLSEEIRRLELNNAFDIDVVAEAEEQHSDGGSDSEPSVDNLPVSKMMRRMKRAKSPRDMVAALRKVTQQKRKKELKLTKKREKKLAKSLAKQEEQARKALECEREAARKLVADAEAVAAAEAAERAAAAAAIRSAEQAKAAAAATRAANEGQYEPRYNRRKGSIFHSKPKHAPKERASQPEEPKVNLPVQIKLVNFQEFDGSRQRKSSFSRDLSQWDGNATCSGDGDWEGAATSTAGSGGGGGGGGGGGRVVAENDLYLHEYSTIPSGLSHVQESQVQKMVVGTGGVSGTPSPTVTATRRPSSAGATVVGGRKGSSSSRLAYHGDDVGWGGGGGGFGSGKSSHDDAAFAALMAGGTMAAAAAAAVAAVEAEAATATSTTATPTAAAGSKPSRSTSGRFSLLSFDEIPDVASTKPARASRSSLRDSTSYHPSSQAVETVKVGTRTVQMEKAAGHEFATQQAHVRGTQQAAGAPVLLVPSAAEREQNAAVHKKGSDGNERDQDRDQEKIWAQRRKWKAHTVVEEKDDAPSSELLRSARISVDDDETFFGGDQVKHLHLHHSNGGGTGGEFIGSGFGGGFGCGGIINGSGGRSPHQRRKGSITTTSPVTAAWLDAHTSTSPSISSHAAAGGGRGEYPGSGAASGEASGQQATNFPYSGRAESPLGTDTSAAHHSSLLYHMPSASTSTLHDYKHKSHSYHPNLLEDVSQSAKLPSPTVGAGLSASVASPIVSGYGRTPFAYTAGTSTDGSLQRQIVHQYADLSAAHSNLRRPASAATTTATATVSAASPSRLHQQQLSGASPAMVRNNSKGSPLGEQELARLMGTTQIVAPAPAPSLASSALIRASSANQAAVIGPAGSGSDTTTHGPAGGGSDTTTHGTLQGSDEIQKAQQHNQPKHQHQHQHQHQQKQQFNQKTSSSTDHKPKHRAKHKKKKK